MITQLFNEILYRPLFNSLIALYNLVPDFGVAIILLTVITRVLLFPLNKKAMHNQEVMKRIQPKLKKIQKKYKQDKVAQTNALMAIYKKYHINPMSSFLPMLVQFPILIALFRVFLNGFHTDKFNVLYSFVMRPNIMNPISLGFLDLSKPSITLALLAGVLQIAQTKIVSPGNNQMSKFVYIMPLLTVFIGLRMAAGLPLYWIIITISSILEFKLYERFTLKNEKH